MSLRLATDKHRVLQHVIAFVLAWLVASFVFAHVMRPITVELPKPGYHIQKVGKGDVATRNLLYLSAALHGGHAIVMLGSSEFDVHFNSGRFAPTNFFPQHHLAKVLTYGAAGFETLSMYGLLSSLKPHLSADSRVVIMLSPQWFSSTDMQPPIFNDNFNDSMLLQLYLSDDKREVFNDYMERHKSDFLFMTSTQKLFLNDPESMLNLDLPAYLTGLVNSRAYGQRTKLDMILSQLQSKDTEEWDGAPLAKDLDWDEYEKNARKMELPRMANNDLWVRDTFYSQFMRKHPKAPIHYFPDDINPEPEMDGLKLLLEMLQRSKVKAMFVMQTVDPRLYDDLGRFAPVDTRVANLCREYGMTYVDMYAQPYEKGMLVDGVHPSELTWVYIDHQMAEFFHL